MAVVRAPTRQALATGACKEAPFVLAKYFRLVTLKYLPTVSREFDQKRHQKPSVLDVPCADGLCPVDSIIAPRSEDREA